MKCSDESNEPHDTIPAPPPPHDTIEFVFIPPNDDVFGSVPHCPDCICDEDTSECEFHAQRPAEE